MKKFISLIVGIFAFALLIQPVFAADESDLEDLAGNEDIAACAADLVAAYGDFEALDDNQAVTDYYENEFSEAYAEANLGSTPDVESILGNLDDNGFYLQHYYLAANEADVGAKNELEDAEDGSDWSAAHAECHSALDTELTERDLYDIFIVNEGGDIAYTVFKETDLATNLNEGSFADSGLGQAFQASSESGELAVSDVLPYWPSYGAAAQFVCAPAGDSGATICLQITPDQIATGDTLASTVSAEEEDEEGDEEEEEEEEESEE